MAAAHRPAGRRDDVSKQFRAPFSAHVLEHAAVPLAVGRLHAQAALPPRVRELRIGLRQILPLHEGGVVRLHEYRSEEHTSELQSQSNLVCRLLLEKKKKKKEKNKLKRKTYKNNIKK